MRKIMLSKNHFQKITLVSLALILLAISGCAVNPVTGKSEFMLLSERDEIALGAQTDKSIVQMYGIYDDQNLHNYLDQMGQKMVKISHRPNLKFEFKVMDSPVINAFAVPGGYVYITRGILAYLNNEAELAGVVGHEIGHVTARHSAQQYSKAQLAQLGLGIGSILSEEFAKYSGLAAQGLGLLFLKFSRDNERQSDDLGVEYSTKVGYDSYEMANFFSTLDQMRAESGSGGLPSWASTHPNPADRVVDVRKKANEWKTKTNAQSYTVDRDGYLNRINGIIFGENPRQGFVEDNMFYHPDMRFQFPVPAGWKVTNLPTQVQIVSADESAAIIFTLATEGSPQAAANKFITDNKVTIISQDDLTINGFTARRVVSNAASQSGQLQILSYFISKDNTIFVFHCIAPQQQYSGYQTVFQSTGQGFAALRDRAKLNVKPNRLRIRKIERAMTLKAALKWFGIADNQLQKMALVNGLDLNQQLTPNTSIKTVDK
jgi:predicted Zn-dependent protease